MRCHGRRRILRIFSISIASNVLGIRRFCSCDKGNRRFPATAKMWWSKMPQRAKPDWRFVEPEPPNRRRSVYRLLCEGFALQLIHFLASLSYNFLCFLSYCIRLVALIPTLISFLILDYI